MLDKEISEITPLVLEKSKFHLFLQSFIELSKSPNDLFYLFTICLVQTIGALIIVTSLSIYFTSIYQLSDITTGCILAGFGASSFFYSIILGSMIDKYGLRANLICGSLSALVGCIILIYSDNLYIHIIAILTLLSGGSSIILPSIKLGVKHYTNDRAKSVGYSMLYILMFTGGAFAGIIVDIALTLNSKDTSTFKILFTLSACFMIMAIFLSFMVIDIETETREKNS